MPEDTYGNRFPENSGSNSSADLSRIIELENKTQHNNINGEIGSNYVLDGAYQQTTLNDEFGSKLDDINNIITDLILKTSGLSEYGTLNAGHVLDEVNGGNQFMINLNTTVELGLADDRISVNESELDIVVAEIAVLNQRIEDIDGGGTAVNAINVTDSVQGKTQQIINNETLALTTQLESDVQTNADDIIVVDDKAITNTANIDALAITVDNLTYVRIFNDLGAGNTMDCTAYSDFGKECGTNQQFNLSNILYGRDYTILLTGGSLHSTPFIGQTIKWEGQDASIYDANKLNKISFYKSSPFGSTQSQLFGVFSQINIL